MRIISLKQSKENKTSKIKKCRKYKVSNNENHI